MKKNANELKWVSTTGELLPDPTCLHDIEFYCEVAKTHESGN
jgi:hypothetical protein